MSLKVVGAGLGRTGTFSLKLALEQLLGGPCYHMMEVFEHPEHVPTWHDAAHGKNVDWRRLMNGYVAAVDWPVSAYWRQLSQAFPDALIVLSLRDSDKWWGSASETIFSGINMSKERPEMGEWHSMVITMLASTFTADLHDREACVSAFEKHNAHVRKAAPKERLLVWEAKDGWAPLCGALGVPIPDAPFPKANTKEEFLARLSAHSE